MKPSGPIDQIRHASDRFAPYAVRLREIFTAMDLAYAAAADKCGFHCSGCEDNCCRTLFYHHTYLELFYLFSGLEGLNPERRAALQSRAKDVCRQMEAAPAESETSQRMCPLNFSGLCGLYAYRPMICRLHGIPHVLQRPDGRKMVGPGCDDFHRQCGSPGDAVLDRTPHYAALASLEREFRQAMGLTDKLRLTVAEMIIQFIY
jgi:hypothetical protein